MAAPISNAIAAYTNAGRVAGAAGPAAADGGESFAALLKQSAGDVGDALHKGEAASLQAVTGKPDLAQVAAAANNAEIALQAVIAVRDRVIQAYNDISKMPI
ncbi:MAG TPA: flagellar hook-basal body complex protein FliE [Stellaceae bacterium]|nr:flagellar hook-basal body complex protein FliE [Stellaceae bacterium]